jgi:hypothetical protein
MSAQEPGLPQHGQDHHQAPGQPIMQFRGGGEAVNPRQAYIHSRRIRMSSATRTRIIVPPARAVRR